MSWLKVHIAAWVLAFMLTVTPSQAKGVALTTRISHAQVELWECQDKIGETHALPDKQPWSLDKSRAYRKRVLAKWTHRKSQCLSVITRRSKVVKVAKSELGTPYVWGGSSPRGFDCSGLVTWAFAKVGIRLPHYSYSLAHAGSPVNGRLQPGDLVFRTGYGHVGIYIGRGKMIHSPQTGSYVKISPLSRIISARRII